MKKFFLPVLVLSLSLLVVLAFMLLSRGFPGSVPSSRKIALSVAPKKAAQKSFAPLSVAKKPMRGAVPLPPHPNDQQVKMIGEIRKDLQAVMDLNQTINSVQQSKSAQLLRVQEQALIHQRILAEIQKGTAVQPVAPSREALLNQEKLRIIREETLRNKKLLEDTTRKATP